MTHALLLVFFMGFGQEADNTRPSLADMPKNGLLITTDYMWSATIGYQRVEPLGDHLAALGRLGVGYTAESGNDATINGDLSLMVGGIRHFGELGVGFYNPLTDSAGFAMFPNLTYRYVGAKGLHIRAGARIGIYTSEEDIENAWEGQYGLWPLLQVGYIWYF